MSTAARTTIRPSTPAPESTTAPLRLEDIDRSEWDRLLALTPSATPFTSWTFHRAWWDAYGESAEPYYLTVGQRPFTGIVPLMLRPGAGGPRVLHFAASYHADYATALRADIDLAAVAAATVEHLLRSDGWDALDLRRLRRTDPLLASLEKALADRRVGQLGWRISRKQEDVCPVLPLAGSWEQQLGRLGKKTRHEIRRKLRRARRNGTLRLRYLPLDERAVSRFIELHQARWGPDGLFAASDDGDRSRTFLHGLAQLEADEEASSFHLVEVTVAERPVHVIAGFAQGGTCYFYNAGLDPGVLDLSPGAVGTALYVGDRIARGDTRFDFLRGDESYKYDWGAIDEPLFRLRVERSDRT